MPDKCCGNCLFWKQAEGAGKCVCERSKSFTSRFAGDMDACNQWSEEDDPSYWDPELEATDAR